MWNALKFAANKFKHNNSNIKTKNVYIEEEHIIFGDSYVNERYNNVSSESIKNDMLLRYDKSIEEEKYIDCVKFCISRIDSENKEGNYDFTRIFLIQDIQKFFDFSYLVQEIDDEFTCKRFLGNNSIVFYKVTHISKNTENIQNITRLCPHVHKISENKADIFWSILLKEKFSKCNPACHYM